MNPHWNMNSPVESCPSGVLPSRYGIGHLTPARTRSGQPESTLRRTRHAEILAALGPGHPYSVRRYGLLGPTGSTPGVVAY